MRRLTMTLAALCALAACNKPAPPADEAPSDQASSTPAPSTTAVTPTAPAAVEAPPPPSTAALADLPAPYSTGDLDNGKAKFAVCRACHTLDAPPPGVPAPVMIGPSLHGVWGRKAGSVAGFAYSDALKGAGFNWDAAHLDAWLTSPQKYLPGTKMPFVGLPNAKDRIDVIAYIKSASGDPA